ncbi:putative assembly protein [Geobacter sp. OR-1]|uniref:YhdP family protein n=1 Tax=Geobacter sp. OR-1 TaxID=1266765 RepID=UPI0005424F59|nr:AsmA-like C-terminal domain-containing protein [Geobacter sp. OR-1]GAM08003.1 putative assembly protein [Geobacter sp. OR-1]
MKINRSAIIVLIISVSILASVIYLTPLLLNRLLDINTYKAEILTQLEKALNRKVLYTQANWDFTLIHGPAFTFSNVVIKEKDSVSDFLAAQRVDVRLSLFHLLEGDIVLSELKLDKPSIALIRYKSGEFNISDLLTSKESGSAVNLKGITLANAEIKLSDMAVTPEGLLLKLSGTNLSLDNLGRGKKTGVKLEAVLQAPDMKSPVSLAGTFRLPKKGNPLRETDISLKLKAKELEPGFFWAYYSHYLPFRKIAGRFDLDLGLKGKSSSFTSSGEITVSGLRFDYPQVFHAVLTPANLHVEYNLERTPTAVNVKSIALKVDNLKVKGSCGILDINTRDPRISAKATTSAFRLEEFRNYIPYGIIVKDTADYIEQHIMGGTYQLDEGSLDGRISQILHMEKGDNYNILHIKGRVEQGLITYGKSVPTFNSIKGVLEMKGKDFILHAMKARFGASPFSLEGRITDYPLVTPCAYPFSMEMKPTQAEIAWLLGQKWGQDLGFSGDSSLHLNGSGTTSSYTITGEWDLTNAAYSYPDLVRKPAGRQNNAGFNCVLTRQEIKLTSLRYTLAPLVLSLAANYRYSGKPWLGVDLKTNRFQVNEIAAMIPKVLPYQPSGILQGAIQGESVTGDPADLAWRGTASMAGCSVRPSGKIRPLSAINGTVSFSGNSLETSQLSARLGSSIIHGKGALSGFNSPSLRLAFSSPLLDPVDLGLIPPIKGMKISGLAGNISLKDKDLNIAALSGQFNKTNIAIKGTIRNTDTSPNADLIVTSPHLDVDDILLLTALEQEKRPATASPPTVKAVITADSVQALDIPFGKTKGELLLENGILYLQPVSTILAGGRLTGNARVDTTQPGPARRMQVGCKLEGAAAESLFHALGVKKQEIKGTVDLQGEFSAKGDTAAEIKRTALGSAKIRIEEGSLKRFSTLSKIFSILNVSQLVKFQLPDMVTGGMPFNEITGNFSIKDGIVATSNLYVDSDAINISAVGSYNLYKDELNATIGVKPLQTIDKVVSHIPLVGWILTGKDKTLVTAYFEAKGQLENPEVKAIPVKGMAKGVFDIFRRIFELPAKLVTDTGEVIIGK